MPSSTAQDWTIRPSLSGSRRDIYDLAATGETLVATLEPVDEGDASRFDDVADLLIAAPFMHGAIVRAIEVLSGEQYADDATLRLLRDLLHTSLRHCSDVS